MRRFGIPEGSAAGATSMTKGERRKIILLSLGAVFVTIAVGTSLLKARSYENRRDGRLPEQGSLQESVLVPDIDRKAIDALVQDSSEIEQVILESEGIDFLQDITRRLTEQHYEALAIKDLDAAAAEMLKQDPASHRGEAFRLRGWVDSVRTQRRSPAGPLEELGRLILEDDTTAYFVTPVQNDAPVVEGDFLRIDGLFLKVFSEESSERNGEWVPGPLLVGGGALRSYPDMGAVTQLEPRHLLGIEDDELFQEDGSAGEWSGLPFEALWHLMAYARDLEASTIDWESVPELDAAAIRQVSADGEPFRAQPFRIPVSRLQGMTVLQAPENPARIEEYASGWIGNTTWKNVIHFQAPLSNRDLSTRDFVTARGFFLKNFAYPSAGKGVHKAPVFVLHSLTEFIPEEDPLLAKLPYAVAGVTLLLILFFFVLLRRDRRKARNLQEDLARRRRARRASKAQAPPTVDPATS